jgi:hypothetical protein
MLTIASKYRFFPNFLVIIVLIVNSLGHVDTIATVNQNKETTEETCKLIEEAIVSERKVHAIKRPCLASNHRSFSPASSSKKLFFRPQTIVAKYAKQIVYRALLI